MRKSIAVFFLVFILWMGCQPAATYANTEIYAAEDSILVRVSLSFLRTEFGDAYSTETIIEKFNTIIDQEYPEAKRKLIEYVDNYIYVSYEYSFNSFAEFSATVSDLIGYPVELALVYDDNPILNKVTLTGLENNEKIFSSRLFDVIEYEQTFGTKSENLRMLSSDELTYSINGLSLNQFFAGQSLSSFDPLKLDGGIQLISTVNQDTQGLDIRIRFNVVAAQNYESSDVGGYLISLVDRYQSNHPSAKIAASIEREDTYSASVNYHDLVFTDIDPTTYSAFVYEAFGINHKIELTSVYDYYYVQRDQEQRDAIQSSGIDVPSKTKAKQQVILSLSMDEQQSDYTRAYQNSSQYIKMYIQENDYTLNDWMVDDGISTGYSSAITVFGDSIQLDGRYSTLYTFVLSTNAVVMSDYLPLFLIGISVLVLAVFAIFVVLRLMKKRSRKLKKKIQESKQKQSASVYALRIWECIENIWKKIWTKETLLGVSVLFTVLLLTAFLLSQLLVYFNPNINAEDTGIFETNFSAFARFPASLYMLLPGPVRVDYFFADYVSNTTVSFAYSSMTNQTLLLFTGLWLLVSFLLIKLLFKFMKNRRYTRNDVFCQLLAISAMFIVLLLLADLLEITSFNASSFSQIQLGSGEKRVLHYLVESALYYLVPAMVFCSLIFAYGLRFTQYPWRRFSYVLRFMLSKWLGIFAVVTLLGIYLLFAQSRWDVMLLLVNITNAVLFVGLGGTIAVDGLLFISTSDPVLYEVSLFHFREFPLVTIILTLVIGWICFFNLHDLMRELKIKKRSTMALLTAVTVTFAVHILMNLSAQKYTYYSYLEPSENTIVQVFFICLLLSYFFLWLNARVSWIASINTFIARYLLVPWFRQPLDGVVIVAAEPSTQIFEEQNIEPDIPAEAKQAFHVDIIANKDNTAESDKVFTRETTVERYGIRPSALADDKKHEPEAVAEQSQPVTDDGFKGHYIDPERGDHDA